MAVPDDSERARLKAEKARKKAARKAERDAKARAGNPRAADGAGADDAEPAIKRRKTGEKGAVPGLNIKKRRLSVDTGEPGGTPKVVHTPLVEATTPLSEREAAAEREEAATRAQENAQLQKLAAHCQKVADAAEAKGGFVASKGGVALVGLVARTISQTPAIGAKNLYKQVCETLGCQPNRGKAPNSREVRKIVASLKEDAEKEAQGLDRVMSSVSPFSGATQRAKLIAKKIEEGPKSEDSATKLFMGNLSWDLQYEEDSASLHAFFKDIPGGVVDICLLKNDKDKFAGTGFVEFATPEAAKAALALHSTECAGRPITLHYAKPRKPKEQQKQNEGLVAQPQRPRPEHCTVVFVGNLRFDIDTKTVKAWAAECGEVTGIRWLNDRHTGKFKGCGYIEFGAKSAETAVDAIVKRNGDMLMGRPVRVDYAEDTRVAGEGNMDEEAEAAAPISPPAAVSQGPVDSTADGGDASSSSSSSNSDDSSSDSDDSSDSDSD